MAFPREGFERFCGRLVLLSKEQGRCRFRWNGSQRRFIGAVADGIDRGIRRFVVLKARQLGITTIGLALDLYWLFGHAGTQGALATPSEPVRDLCRNLLDAYQDSLPPTSRWPAVISNRTELRFANRSRLAYLIAGGRNSGALARGQGLNFLHATEVSSWTDEEGVVSLDASLAEQNPERLYVFESTARGYNVFHDLWRDAVRSRVTAAVFIGWWAKGEYSIARDSTLWPTYGRARLQREEQALHRAVLKQYGHEITPEQWAWWRWKWAEKGGSKLLYAEYPFTAEQAFVMTGSEFFDAELLDACAKYAERQRRDAWTYRIRARFDQTELRPEDEGPLSVWEEPQDGCDYIIAADPAYGESEWADCFCAQVLRADASGLVQVAEFDSPDCTMYGFAWILAHLCGAYSTPAHPPTLILELGGPGRGVLQELQRMPDQYLAQVEGLADGARQRLADLFGSIQHFLYRRPDSFSGSRLLQWETTFKTKAVMLNTLRDLLTRGMLTVSSPEFVDECRFVTQDGSRIGAEGRTHKDDRVIAMGLACMAWEEQVLPGLLARGPAPAELENPVARSVAGWLARLQDQRDDDAARLAGVETWQE